MKAKFHITCSVTNGKWSNVTHEHDAVEYAFSAGGLQLKDTRGVTYHYPPYQLVYVSVIEVECAA